jgi:hypothetical protein
MFWLDPNPKKSSDLDSDPDTVVKKKLVKIADQTLEREKNGRFSVGKHFSLSYRFQNTYRKKAIRGTFKKKNSGQNICIRIRTRNRIRKKLDPNPKKMSSDPQHW